MSDISIKPLEKESGLGICFSFSKTEAEAEAEPEVGVFCFSALACSTLPSHFLWIAFVSTDSVASGPLVPWAIRAPSGGNVFRQ